MNPQGEHFNEITALLFAEGELDSAQRASVSAHLEGCSACRVLLETLTRESELLGQALFEETEPIPVGLLNAPLRTVRHIAPWTWAFSFSVVGAAVYAAWLLILSPWLDQMDQVGVGSINLLATMFFTGAFWEGWDSMLDTLQYATLLAAGFGVLFLSLRQCRRRPGVALLLAGLALFLSAPRSANAAEIRRGPSVNVAEGETLHNDLIAAGNSLRVDGTVDGDVIAFAQNVTVDGHVTGDVIAFAKTVRITGPVDGNVRCFCEALTLEGPIRKNVSIFAADAEIERRSAIEGGVIAFAGNIVADGKVTRDLLFFARTTSLNGTIGGNIRLRGGVFTIGPNAQVTGTVHVISDRKPDVSASAKLAQSLDFEYRPQRTGYRSGRVVVGPVLRYAAAFLFGLLLITALPGLFGAGMRATRQVGMSLGVGAIVLICGFALAIFSLLLLLAGVRTGIAVVFLFAPIVYGSQVFVGTWIGEKLRRPATISRALLGRLALGLLLLHLVEIIPVLGWLVWLAAVTWGTGALCMALWECLGIEKHASAAPMLNP